MPDTPDNPEAAQPPRAPDFGFNAPIQQALPADVPSFADLPGFGPMLDPRVVQSHLVYQKTSFRSAPIPSPQELGAYEREVPDSAQWILDEARHDAKHVRDMELGALDMAKRDSLLRHLLPAFIVFSFLASSVLLAIFSDKIVGILAFIGTVAGVVTLYIRQSRRDDDDGDDQDAKGDEADAEQEPP